MEEEELTKIESMLMIYGKIVQQTLECAYFISHYSETKSACELILLLCPWRLDVHVCIGIRFGKHIFDRMDTMIQSYNNVLNSLMQQFRDWAAYDTIVITHHMGKSWVQVFLRLIWHLTTPCIAEILDLAGMEYASGTGLNTSKCCLPNTQQDLLKDIQNWISSTEKLHTSYNCLAQQARVNQLLLIQ